MTPLCAINMCVFVLCPFIFHFFVNHIGWGLFGAAMAQNSTAAVTSLSMLATAVYIHQSNGVDDTKRRAWPGLSSDALKVWKFGVTESRSWGITMFHLIFYSAV
jgi:hypothetical protein